MSDPLIKRRLGRYQIEQEIGRGGMAKVYRAIDTLLQRPVALKILSPHLGDDAALAQRFEREAITAANLRHPAIITIFDVGEADGFKYIAMEYIAGRTLQEVLVERTRLTLTQGIAVLQPVAEALDYAHGRGAIHRDVKPHNILIDHDGRVLLTDFGIAISIADNGERLTRAGSFMGTPEYVSPELAQGQPITGQSDLYSLAIVAYEALAGRVPFEGPTPQLIIAHAYTHPPQITSVDPKLPREVNTIFARALAKDPLDRFTQATAFIEQLHGVARKYAMPMATQADVAALAVSAPAPGYTAPHTPTPQPPHPSVVEPDPTTAPITDLQTTSPSVVPATSGSVDPVFNRPPSIKPQGAPQGSVQGHATPASAPQRPAPQPQHRRSGDGPARPRSVVTSPIPPQTNRTRWTVPEHRSITVPWSLALVGATVLILVALLIAQSYNARARARNARGTPSIFAPTQTSLVPTSESLAGAVTTIVPATPIPTSTNIPPTEVTATVAPTPVPPTPTVSPPPSPTIAAVIPPATETALVSTPTAEATVPPERTAEATSETVVAIGPTPVGGANTIIADIGSGLQQLNLRDHSKLELIPDQRVTGPVAISPDGATILFDTTNGDRRQIYRLDRASEQIEPWLTTEGNSYHPAWSPDGKRIVYTSTVDGNPELYAANADGTQPERLTNDPAEDDYPSWLPDGKQVVWESHRDGRWSIYLQNSDGLRRLAPVVRGTDDRYPRVSPDGTQVVFASNRDRLDKGMELYLVPLDGGPLRRLTTFESGTASGPQWSPDGEVILFFSDTTGNNDLYLVRISDHVIIPIGTTSEDERWPVWVP